MLLAYFAADAILWYWNIFTLRYMVERIKINHVRFSIVYVSENAIEVRYLILFYTGIVSSSVGQ